MSGRNPDTVYDRTHPWQSNPERLISAQLDAATVPGGMIELLRPTIPQMVFRPIYGYPSYADRQVTIDQVVRQQYIQAPADYSGRTSGYSGSLRNGFPALNTF